MVATQVARLLAVIMLFLETTDEDEIDPDIAVEKMERIAYLLEGIGKPFLDGLTTSFEDVSTEFPASKREFVRDIPYGLYLEE